MSWTAEATIIAGYIIEDKEIWKAACEKQEEVDENEEWSDFFILTDPISEDGTTIFGMRIYTVDEMSYPKNIDSIYCNFKDIETIQKGFNLFFADYYLEKDKPKFGKYLTLMWT